MAVESSWLPDEVVAQLRHAPFRPFLEAMVHTTVYDTTVICAPPDIGDLAGITAPALIIAGGKSTNNFKRADERLASALPNGRFVCLDEQNHDIVAAVLAPVVIEFLLP